MLGNIKYQVDEGFYVSWHHFLVIFCQKMTKWHKIMLCIQINRMSLIYNVDTKFLVSIVQLLLQCNDCVSLCAVKYDNTSLRCSRAACSSCRAAWLQRCTYWCFTHKTDNCRACLSASVLQCSDPCDLRCSNYFFQTLPAPCTTVH